MCLLSLFMSVMENMQNSRSFVFVTLLLPTNTKPQYHIEFETGMQEFTFIRSKEFAFFAFDSFKAINLNQSSYRSQSIQNDNIGSTFFTKLIEYFLINSNVFSDVNLKLLVAQCCYYIYHRDASCDLGERLPSGNSGRFKQSDHIKFCSPYTTMQGNRKQIGRGKPFM